MLDSDLAGLYGVTTKRLNEQVRRNLSRFPDDSHVSIDRVGDSTSSGRKLRPQRRGEEDGVTNPMC